LRLAALLLLLAACRSPGKSLKPFGSPCSSDEECGTTNRYFCAPDHPGGYCVAECRSDEECGGGVCVRADPASIGQCHAACVNTAGCRAGYLCKLTSNDASAPYCDPPSSRHIQRRLRGWWWR
jgi:hypothetical protein